MKKPVNAENVSLYVDPSSDLLGVLSGMHTEEGTQAIELHTAPLAIVTLDLLSKLDDYNTETLGSIADEKIELTKRPHTQEMSGSVLRIKLGLLPASDLREKLSSLRVLRFRNVVDDYNQKSIEVFTDIDAINRIKDPTKYNHAVGNLLDILTSEPPVAFANHPRLVRIPRQVSTAPAPRVSTYS